MFDLNFFLVISCGIASGFFLRPIFDFCFYAIAGRATQHRVIKMLLSCVFAVVISGLIILLPLWFINLLPLGKQVPFWVIALYIGAIIYKVCAHYYWPNKSFKRDA